MKKENETGITLLALVITIIVLLILAGITISAITGDNGIIGNAGRAKEETEIANEKEIVEKATVQAMGNNKYGNIEESELQKQLNRETGEGKTEATDIGDEFEVVFNESNRYYMVDKDGNVGEAQDIIKDKNPGDITTGKDGETLDGSEEKPYEIWCIEDLLEWYDNYNTYLNSEIILCRNLNFKSKYSYADSERIDYGDVNEDNVTDSLIQEMQTGKGFKPIANFSGHFNGQDYKVDNIYIDYTGTTKNVGLFSGVSNAEISNLEISGNILGNSAGGIIGIGSLNVTCVRLKNKCNIHGEGRGAGGIIGYYEYGKELKIINCENLGNILGKNSTNVGGIVGCAYAPNDSSNQEVYIYNSSNQAMVETRNGNAGGMIGYLNSDGAGYSNGKIYNCYNTGKISVTEKLGQANGNTGGIYGLFRSMVSASLEIKNSYILSELDLKVGTSGWSCLVNGEKINDDYINAKFLEKSYMQSQEFVNDLNTFKLEGEDLDYWKLKEKGYPILK